MHLGEFGRRKLKVDLNPTLNEWMDGRTDDRSMRQEEADQAKAKAKLHALREFKYSLLDMLDLISPLICWIFNIKSCI